MPPFIAEFRSNLDWAAWERFSKLPGAFYYDSKVLMHHRIHQESETSALIKDDTREKEECSLCSSGFGLLLLRGCCLNSIAEDRRATNCSGEFLLSCL